jgi:hypothetical protein
VKNPAQNASATGVNCKQFDRAWFDSKITNFDFAKGSTLSDNACLRRTERSTRSVQELLSVSR